MTWRRAVAGCAGLLLCVGAVHAEGLGTAAAAERALAQPQRPASVVERTALLSITRAGSRLVAVGEHGVIAWSGDHGQQWRAAQSGTDATLTQVRFADAQQGWAVGHLGVVLHSSDGGQTWQRQLDGSRAARLAFTQAATDVARSEAQRALADGPDKPWLDLLVESPDRITLIGAFNMAMQSSDGGKQWRSVSASLSNPSAYHLYGVAALGAQQLVVGEHGLLLKGSVAQGFVPLASPYEGSFFGVAVLNANTYLAYGLRGNAYRTEDAGVSWQRASIPGATASFNSAVVLGAGQLALCDQAGRVFVSQDAGRNFSLLPSGGAPATGLVPSADGGLVLATLGGIVKIPAAAVKSAFDKKI